MSMSALYAILPASFLLLFAAKAAAVEYHKATEGHEVVMSKLYPKSERFEIDGPNLGFIMNQSYVNTLLVGGGASYFLDENLGFNLSFNLGINKDKGERDCIESFYFDPRGEVGSSCGSSEALDAVKASRTSTGNAAQDRFPLYGPAYVPIREIQNIILANAVWAPVYGKQLVLLSFTSYFDLFTELGLGIANSKFYSQQKTLRNGKKSRDVYSKPGDANEQSNLEIGALPDEDPISYGVQGRPDPVAENNVLLNLGLGQKFHFGRMFHIKIFVRNMTLLGTDKGFENLLAVYGGAGIRF